jgi:DNA-binding NtrC family response regulator
MQVIQQAGSASNSTVLSPLRQTSFAGIVSENVKMQSVFALISKVARTNSTVLILGESGTGKELVAKALHKLSGRTGRMVPVNCAAIPEDILESELFGHEKGSFTGASTAKVGRFQAAQGGTIFLDEIGDMTPKLQVKLLRVLQERRVDPVGSTRSIDIDVRVIAATNKDLRAEVKAGRFREDLYYRLQVVPVELPSLRERGDDVELLARFFMERCCQAAGRDTLEFSGEAMSAFKRYRWPGNIRELENLVERLSILSEGASVSSRDLPDYVARGDASGFSYLSGPSTRFLEVSETLPSDGLDFNAVVDRFETQLLTQALERTSWNKKAAAELLKLNRTTLVEKLKKKGLERQVEAISILSSDSRPPRELFE